MRDERAGPAQCVAVAASHWWLAAAVSWVEATVPKDYAVRGQDQYICFPVPLPDHPSKIVSIQPLSEQSVVHHMLLFGECLGLLASQVLSTG